MSRVVVAAGSVLVVRVGGCFGDARLCGGMCFHEEKSCLVWSKKSVREEVAVDMRTAGLSLDRMAVSVDELLTRSGLPSKRTHLIALVDDSRSLR